jgi:phage-related protein (TIGR01555 family)
MTLVDKSQNPENEDVIVKHLRKDGWSNLFSSIGKRGKDKTDGNFFTSSDYNLWDDNALTELYTYDGLGAKIINRKADDMTRTWFTIQNDTDGLIQEELKELKAHSEINKAIKWARLYRGCLILILFEGDLTPLDKPVNPNTIKGISGLRIYSAPRVNITTTDIVDNPRSPYFDEVEIYPVRKRNGEMLKVHASRCLVFKGIPVPDYSELLDFQYRYWGVPLFVQVYDRLSNYGVVEKGICNIMQEATIGKFVLNNLASLLAQNDNESLDKIYTRIEIINTSKSVINAVLLGEGEEYTRDTVNLSGIEGVVDRMMMNLSAVTDYPVTILFGRSPAGQNATGESDYW